MRSLIMTMSLVLLFFLAGSSAYPVNETVGDFRIGFESINDTNIVVKAWGGPDVFRSSPMEPPSLDVEKVYMVVAGNLSEDAFGGCLVLVTRNPINASIEYTQELILKNSTESFVRVFNRSIDGNDATLIAYGDEPNDPTTEYLAMYWLDELDGMATKAVAVISSWPWDEGTEQLLNTVHVQELNLTTNSS